MEMSAVTRRYDIDWLRVIAIGLLLLYHSAIGFQQWGIMIGFITSPTSWESLWTPMMMLNVWRIPLLFFVSGMGVYFAMQNRNWKQLLKDRTIRIFIPFVFGIFVVVPIHVYLWQMYYSWKGTYSPNPAHLWFLGNIFLYVIILLPVFSYLKRNENGKLISSLKKSLSSPLGLLPVVAAFIFEAMIVDPRPFELYAMTWHGFVLGLLSFFFGFCFVLCNKTFWPMIIKWRWLFLPIAVILFLLRVNGYVTATSLLVIESQAWIFSVFAFSGLYLNRPSKALDYLSQAVYPIYITHMVFLYIASILIFPLNIGASFQFALVLAFTGLGCFITYEWGIRRVAFIRPLFGMK